MKRISYFPKPYTQYGGGVKGYLNKVQVVDLIEFTGGDALTPVQGGYVANTLDDDIPFAS